jgi:hypothetical protein
LGESRKPRPSNGASESSIASTPRSGLADSADRVQLVGDRRRRAVVLRPALADDRRRTDETALGG